MQVGRRRVVIAVLAALASVAGSYAVAGASARFLLARFNAVLIDATPGVVSASLIGTVGHLAAVAAFVTASLAGILILTGATIAGMLAGDSLDVQYARPAMVLLFLWDVVALTTGEFTTALLPAAAGGAVVAVAYNRTDSPTSVSRRAVLRAASGTVAIGVVNVLVGSGRQDGANLTYDPPDIVDQQLRRANSRSLAIDGLEPLVSQEFYQVDINQINPIISVDDWVLSVTGVDDSPLSLNYADLQAMVTEHRFVTLRCVGDPVDGEKLDTALWTGAPIDTVLAAAGVLPSDADEKETQDDIGGMTGTAESGPSERCCVMLHAEDGYYEELPLGALRGGLLAWGMNGEPLPKKHGRPVRVLVPGHWGEINVKWLTKIELLDEPAEGYWEQRGWFGTGPVNTVAKLTLTQALDDGRIRLAGHAYAGTRGISRVEVSTDGGTTWSAAQLSEPLPGSVQTESELDAEDTDVATTANSSNSTVAAESATDAWCQWVREYRPPNGSHEVLVRAVESDGTIQPQERTDSYPRGATGWVRRQIDP